MDFLTHYDPPLQSGTAKPACKLCQDGRGVIASAIVPDSDVADLFLTH